MEQLRNYRAGDGTKSEKLSRTNALSVGNNIIYSKETKDGRDD